MPFQPRQPPISQRPKCSLRRSEKSRFVGDERRVQTWRRTELPQMLKVATIDSHNHVGSQALHEVRHRLVIVHLWLLFPGDLQGGFQLISRLRLWLEFMVFFQHDTPYMVVQTPDALVQWVRIWKVSMNPREFACSQFCMMLER